MRSQCNILLLLVASCALQVSGKVILQPPPSFDLHRVAKQPALNELLETSAIFNDIVWIANDPHLYWKDCSAVNNFEEKIEHDHNQTTVYLSVTQPCVEDNIALTDFQVSVDAGRRLSVSAKVSSGDNASLSKQYQLPSLAASGLISAAYTPDRVLRVTIPHLSPDDLAPTDIPITIEPTPEPQHPAAAEPTQEQTHATVGKNVELLPEQQDIEGVRFQIDVESNPFNVQSQEMPVLESESGIDSDIPRKPQGKEKEGKREREERLRAYLLEYEGKLAAYSDEITRLASFRGVNSRDGLPSHDNSEHKLFSTGNSKHRSDDQPHTVAPTTGNQRKPQREAVKPYYLQDVGAESAAQKKSSPTTSSSFSTPSASPTKVHIADDSYIAGAKARAAQGKTSKSAAAPTAGVSSEKEPKSTTEKQSQVDQKPASGNKKPAAGNKQPVSPEPKKPEETRGSQPTSAEHVVNKEQHEQKPPQRSSSSHQHTEKAKHEPGRVEQSHRQEWKRQPERVGARESLKAQDDPYRPMPTRRAVQKAEEEASSRRMHSDDVKENVQRLEGELARLRGLLATA